MHRRIISRCSGYPGQVVSAAAGNEGSTIETKNAYAVEAASRQRPARANPTHGVSRTAAAHPYHTIPHTTYQSSTTLRSTQPHVRPAAFHRRPDPSMVLCYSMVLTGCPVPVGVGDNNEGLLQFFQNNPSTRIPRQSPWLRLASRRRRASSVEILFSDSSCPSAIRARDGGQCILRYYGSMVPWHGSCHDRPSSSYNGECCPGLAALRRI